VGGNNLSVVIYGHNTQRAGGHVTVLTSLHASFNAVLPLVFKSKQNLEWKGVPKCVSNTALQIRPLRFNHNTTDFYLHGLVLHMYNEMAGMKMIITEVWFPLRARNRFIQNVLSIQVRLPLRAHNKRASRYCYHSEHATKGYIETKCSQYRDMVPTEYATKCRTFKQRVSITQYNRS
jgi:hypothetical protein